MKQALYSQDGVTFMDVETPKERAARKVRDATTLADVKAAVKEYFESE